MSRSQLLIAVLASAGLLNGPNPRIGQHEVVALKDPLQAFVYENPVLITGGKTSEAGVQNHTPRNQRSSHADVRG